MRTVPSLHNKSLKSRALCVYITVPEERRTGLLILNSPHAMLAGWVDAPMLDVDSAQWCHITTDNTHIETVPMLRDTNKEAFIFGSGTAVVIHSMMHTL